MPVDRSELSSLSALLTQLTERIAKMGEGASALHEDDVAKELFGIERALIGASRRLARLINSGR